MSFDARRLRDVLGRFATGIIVVTAATENGERLGMTMSSFNSVSLDPPLVLFSIHKKARSFGAWQSTRHYAINILGEDQEDIANRFARAKEDKWQDLKICTGSNGVPLLPGCPAAFECEAYARHDGGDHEIFVGLVLRLHEAASRKTSPLVFFEGRFRALASAESAHRPPDEAIYLHGW